MIVRPRPKAWELFFIFRHSILRVIAPQLAAIILFSAGVVWLEHRFPNAFRLWSVAPFTLLGIALSIFLGFRNSACYDRWWEARRQLGALIGEMRSLARIAVSLPGADRERRKRIVRRAIAYVRALTAHLRRESIFDPEFATARNLPDAILRAVASEYSAMLAEGEIGEPVWKLFEERVTAIAAIQVACERIGSTPTPFAYTLLLHRTAYAFCFLLPFSLASTLGFATPLFCGVVAYAFFGLDALGTELEEPFGCSINALPLNAMARIMEISLLEALGETSIPPPIEPEDYILR